jgi:chloramphenicol 3-O-phosphotransferase
MINGAFGAGKTSVANAFLQRMENAMLFDPEEVGYMLRTVIPEHVKLAEERTGDFQDLTLWPTMTVHTAEQLQRTYGKDLIVPMTIVNKTYFQYILDGFKKIDQETQHFCLAAKKETIHHRLLERGEPEGNWCFQQTERCLAAYEDESFGKFIQTDDLSVEEIVDEIMNEIDVALLTK